MNRIEKQLKDFAQGGVGLIWQRQVMFLGAAFLTAYFYSVSIAIPCYLFAISTELLDIYITKSIMKWDGQGDAKAKRFVHLLTISSVCSGAAISVFVLVVARQEGHTTHLAPLLFLLSAALYAAVNNHQLFRVLIVRLLVYGGTFLYIPIYDLWIVRPPFKSPLWLQLATCLFVLYFIIECSRIFLRLYQNNLNQLEDLKLERDRAERAYEIQSQFVSIVSHELRTPLTSIKGALGLIKSGGLGDTPEKIDGVVEIAYKNSNRLAALIDDLLDVQKFDAGKMDFQLVPLDIAQLIEDAIEANESFGNSMNISLETSGVEKSIYINGDHDRLMQVMANVLSNAIKFSETGGVVDISLEELTSKARISVKDCGVGIPENSRDKVFEQFTQVDSSIQRKIGGTGLGMYITKEILDGHDGTIDFSSEIGIGTTFFIELNKVDAQPVPT